MSKMTNSTDVPLRKEGYTQVKGLIESIENDRNSDAFREPVDWEGELSNDAAFWLKTRPFSSNLKRAFFL